MTSASDRITTLLAWCSVNGIKIDPRLCIEHDAQTEITVFSGDAHIPDSVTLVQIPKSTVLSVKSCSLSNLIPPIHYGYGARLALSFALYIELTKRESSRWSGYLQSLPDDLFDIPSFWLFDQEGQPHRRRREDGAEALKWLRGTEADKLLRGSTDSGTSILDEARHYYYRVVEPLFSEHLPISSHSPILAPTLRGFCHAYSLVSSRAFLVDAYHGLAMVPIADAFNHAQDNHVHLESDYDVCALCGSLQECPHDHDNDTFDRGTFSPIVAAPSLDQDLDNCYEMVSNSPILPNSEVFNTYGDNLSNAQLLVRYGFVLDVNENDCLTWELKELSDFMDEFFLREAQNSSPRGLNLTDLWEKICEYPSEVWKRFSNSRLVYYHCVTIPGTTINDGGCLSLNGDGKISHRLWIYCALSGCLRNLQRKSTGIGVEGEIAIIVDILGQLIDIQLELECEAESAIEGDDLDSTGVQSMERTGTFSSLECPTPASVADIARTVMALCAARQESTGAEEAQSTSVQNLGDILDSLPEDMSRTRMAMMQVMSERSILESCHSGWAEILAVAHRLPDN